MVLYARGASIKSNENRLTVFERKILREIYRHKRNEEEHTYERRTKHAELRALFDEPNVVKSRRISRAGRVWRAEGQTTNDEITMMETRRKTTKTAD